MELEILLLICKEKSSEEIASILAISSYSVDHYRRKISIKTGEKTALGMYKFAVRNGFIDAPPLFL